MPARSRTRQPGPIKRTIVTPATPVSSTAAMLRSPMPAPAATTRTRRAPRVSMTGAQRDSAGRRSDWNRPMNLRPGSTPMVAAWSPTRTTMPRGTVAPSGISSRD